VVGRDVTTDQILPGRHLDRPYEEVGQFALTGLDESFPSRIASGDILVAGPNFGCGSSREAAVVALRAAGIAAVVAPSFGGIFVRNAVNHGLVPAVIDDTREIRDGDAVEVDLEARAVRVAGPGTEPRVHPIRNLTGISRDILAAGGLVPYVKARLGRGAS